MPKRYTRKRRTRRRKKKTQMFSRRSMPGFPSNKVVKMRYVDTFELDPAAGTVAPWIFRANGIFDPDQTGIGHQPLGHDQWAQYYNHAVVIGSKINVKFIYSDATQTDGQLCGCYLSDDTSFPTSASTLMEQGLGKYRLMSMSVIGSPSVVSINNTFSAKKFFNITDIKDNLDRLGSTFGANPADEASYIVWVGAIDAISNPGKTKILVTIDYIVSLSEPKALAQS